MTSTLPASASGSPAIAAWSAARSCAGSRARTARSSPPAATSSTCATRPRSSAWMAREQPDAVFLAAAKVGGILANDSYPGRLPLRQSDDRGERHRGARHDAGVEKLLFLGSTCIYPKLAAQPIAEDALLTGPLEPTNEWYAIAKIAGIKLVRRPIAGSTAATSSRRCRPTSTAPATISTCRSSHVLPALIRKAHEAEAAAATGRSRSGAPARRGANSCMSTIAPTPACS